MPQVLYKKVSLRRPVIVLLLGLVILAVPYASTIIEDHNPDAWNASWGALVNGFYLYPLGLALAVPALIIVIKRLARKQ